MDIMNKIKSEDEEDCTARVDGSRENTEQDSPHFVKPEYEDIMQKIKLEDEENCGPRDGEVPEQMLHSPHFVKSEYEIDITHMKIEENECDPSAFDIEVKDEYDALLGNDLPKKSEDEIDAETFTIDVPVLHQQEENSVDTAGVNPSPQTSRVKSSKRKFEEVDTIDQKMEEIHKRQLHILELQERKERLQTYLMEQEILKEGFQQPERHAKN